MSLEHRRRLENFKNHLGSPDANGFLKNISDTLQSWVEYQQDLRDLLTEFVERILDENDILELENAKLRHEKAQLINAIQEMRH